MNAGVLTTGASRITLVDEQWPWWTLLTPNVLLVLLGIAIFLMVLVVAAGLLAYRRLRRSGLVGRTVLELQAGLGTPGPRRQLAQLRLQLQEAISSTSAAIDALEASHRPQRELALLTRQLTPVAAILDTQLRLLQEETDAELLQEYLEPARASVMELVRTAQHIRQVVYAILEGEAEGTLTLTMSDVEREVLALQAGVEALRRLTLG